MGNYHLQYLSLLMMNCSEHKQQGELVQIVAQPSCAPASPPKLQRMTEQTQYSAGHAV